MPQLIWSHNSVLTELTILTLLLGNFEIYWSNVSFQKISMPTPRKVNGNSKEEGGFKGPIFGRKVWHKNGISGVVGGFKLKNLPREGYGYFLEQHNAEKYRTKDSNKISYNRHWLINQYTTDYYTQIMFIPMYHNVYRYSGVLL